MNTIYMHRTKFNTISSNFELPEDVDNDKGYNYFIRLVPLFDRSDVVYKIGTTNRPLQRMKEHLKQYDYMYNIEVLWFSRKYSWSTILAVERKMKKFWIDFLGWEYIPNDRFIIPKSITEIFIKVRKDYIIKIQSFSYLIRRITSNF